MRLGLLLGLLTLGLLTVSCSGPQTTLEPAGALPPVAMTTARDVDTPACRKRCAATTDTCMSACTSARDEESCAVQAVRCMDRCKAESGDDLL